MPRPAPLTAHFRPATPADAARIAEFQVAMAWETEKLRLDPPTVQAGVDAVFKDPAKGQYLVCETEGAVAGSLLLIPEWSDWRNGRVLWIHSVYLVPECRGQKLYSRFYAHVQAMANADPQIRGLRLYVDRSNEPAQAVYAKLGMNGDHYCLFEWMKTF